MPTPQEVTDFRDLCTREPMVPEEIITAFYRSLLNSTDTAIDCGAHTGYHTRPLAEHCKKGTVVAYEGLPHLAEKLAERHKNDDHVHIRHKAIQNDPAISSTTFQFVPDRPGRSGIRSATINTGDANQYDFEELTVPATTVDQDLAEIGVLHESVKFVKLDLEGGEFRALKGMAKVLREGQPIIAMENGFHAATVGGFTHEDVQTFFDELGYQQFTVFGDAFEGQDTKFWYIFAAPATHAAQVACLIAALGSTAAMRRARYNA